MGDRRRVEERISGKSSGSASEASDADVFVLSEVGRKKDDGDSNQFDSVWLRSKESD